MNFPFWDVPIIGGVWVIGAISIFHVMISHFAVGGGLYLPLAERKALREGRRDWLEALHRHTRFFVVLTGVFGAVSGVGIWFSIGLVNPEGTSTLIHNFVFGWAIEWVFFLVELTAAAVYYYTWDRIPEKLHLKVGWVYGVASIFTLVIINGILTFMLTPGETWLAAADNGTATSAFWAAFFNPTYWPSLGLRVLVAVSLAGLYGLISASRLDGFAQPELKTALVRWSAKWLWPAFALMPVFFLWYLSTVPEASRQLLTLGVSTIGQGVFTNVTRAALVTVMTSATILAIVYSVACRLPTSLNTGWAVSILGLALMATASTEQAREMLRKPYVVGGYMYSNGVRVRDVARLNREGYLTGSPWAPSSAGGIVPVADGMSPTLAAGEHMFRGQCLSCHTTDGYRAMRQLLQGRNRESIGRFLETLHAAADDSPYRAFMPPLVGTRQEIDALADYLAALTARPATSLHAAAASAPRTP